MSTSLDEIVQEVSGETPLRIYSTLYLPLAILNDNSGRALVGPAETIENDAVFDRLGAVFDPKRRRNDRKRRRNEAFEFDSNCQAPQRAWQFESNSNATEKMAFAICATFRPLATVIL